MDNRKITLAITTYNRYDLLVKSFSRVLLDKRISEIVIVDDHSSMNVFKSVSKLVEVNEKIKVLRNPINLGVYKNKYQSVLHSSNEWVIVFDSDNIIDTDYIDTLYEYGWLKDMVYCPDFAKPKFDYRHFAGLIIDHRNAAHFFKEKQFDCLINTMNCFVNREEFLKVYDESTEPSAADSAYFNYRWLMSGNKMWVIPGLQYEHLVHPGSHYVQNIGASNAFHAKMMNAFKNMK